MIPTVIVVGVPDVDKDADVVVVADDESVGFELDDDAMLSQLVMWDCMSRSICDACNVLNDTLCTHVRLHRRTHLTTSIEVCFIALGSGHMQ